ncbi:MAG: extracellular solute-binding protein [Chloroflexi bacterium]|nr:extracellular solute-binding protein [Chloroflexota bacterium]
MNRLLLVSIIILLAGLLSGSCRQAVAPSPVEEEKGPAAGISTGASKPAWEQQWDNTTAEAKKEGKLVFIGSGGSALREVGMDKLLREKFGIAVELIGGGASEIIPKLVAERRAGLYLEDVFVLSTNSFINQLKPNGLTEPLDKMIILPEALDTKAWYNGDLPWVDKDHHQLALLAMPAATILINTELVKPDEIKSYRDLLNPKWKGKIVLVDPSQSGGGASWFSAMAEGIMDLNYLREFAKQEPVISRDDRLMGEWIARGKYPVSVGLGSKIVEEFRRAGAPIQVISAAEGTFVETASAALTVMKNPAHPNAAKLFANWILTREGITFMARAYGGQAARVDVPTDFLDPKQVRQPGVNYLDSNNEQYSIRKGEYLKVAAQIFAGSLK